MKTIGLLIVLAFCMGNANPQGDSNYADRKSVVVFNNGKNLLCHEVIVKDFKVLAIFHHAWGNEVREYKQESVKNLLHIKDLQ